MTTTDHGRSRYRRGCRCDVCRQANREYQRDHRAKQLQAVPAPEPVSSGVVTPVVDAVQAEIDASPIAGQRPGLAAIALAMARILDNPHAIPQQPAAAALAVYCETWSRYVKAVQQCRAEGLVLTNPGSGRTHANPAAAIAHTAAAQMLRFAQEFGLTPAAEARLATAPIDDSDTTDDPFTAG